MGGQQGAAGRHDACGRAAVACGATAIAARLHICDFGLQKRDPGTRAMLEQVLAQPAAADAAIGAANAHLQVVGGLQ